MKTYIVITGTLFCLLTVIHIWRATQEQQLATEPWFITITLAAAALSVWALRLLWRWRKP